MAHSSVGQVAVARGLTGTGARATREGSAAARTAVPETSEVIDVALTGLLVVLFALATVGFLR